MSNARQLDWNYSKHVPRLFGVFTAIAILGWVVSAFLSGIHFWAVPLIPPEADISGSLEVITSSWAYVGSIPLATLGMFYYMTAILMAVWWLDTRHPLIVKILTPITATGVVASAYFVYLQLGVIGSICPFCMISAAGSTMLFILELVILRQSDIPKVGEMRGEIDELIGMTTFKWLVIIGAIGLLTLGAFYGATLAPVPTG